MALFFGNAACASGLQITCGVQQRLCALRALHYWILDHVQDDKTTPMITTCFFESAFFFRAA